MKVGVAGLGLIGGSLLRALGGVGYDADPAVRAAASTEGFEVAEALEGLRGCELVFVAVPPARTYAVVDEVLAAVPDAAVADTASVKGAVPERERFVAAHPMAGAETSGWAASTPDLLRGATWAACPSSRELEPLLRLAAAVDALGGRLIACDAKSHDHAVARASHMPHLVSTALAMSVSTDPQACALAGTGFRDMTRLARSDASMWAAILSANRAQVMSAVDDLTQTLATLRGALDDPAAIELAWAHGAGVLQGIDAIPAWSDEAIDGWGGLQMLGTEGRTVRRLRLEDGALWAEVAR